MSDGPADERLKRLDERLRRAKDAVNPPETTGPDGHSQGELAWRMVTELVAGLVVGFGVGIGLDAIFGTRPIFLVVFILLGFVAGVKVIIRTATAAQQQIEAESSAKDEGD